MSAMVRVWRGRQLMGNRLAPLVRLTCRSQMQSIAKREIETLPTNIAKGWQLALLVRSTSRWHVQMESIAKEEVLPKIVNKCCQRLAFGTTSHQTDLSVQNTKYCQKLVIVNWAYSLRNVRVMYEGLQQRGGGEVSGCLKLQWGEVNYCVGEIYRCIPQIYGLLTTHLLSFKVKTRPDV